MKMGIELHDYLNFSTFSFFPTKIVTTLDSEPKENVIRERASNRTGDPAPCAELEPTSS